MSIVGKKGETSQQIKDECRVDIRFSAKKDKESTGDEAVVSSEPNVNNITGLKEDCERAKKVIFVLATLFRRSLL